MRHANPEVSCPLLDKSARARDLERIGLVDGRIEVGMVGLRVEHQALAGLDVPYRRGAGVDKRVGFTRETQRAALEVDDVSARVVVLDEARLKNAALLEVDDGSDGKRVEIVSRSARIHRKPRAAFDCRRRDRAEDVEDAVREFRTVSSIRVREAVATEEETSARDRERAAARDRHRARAAVGADGEALRVAWVRAGEVSL